jgi:hypothetical protein
MAAKGQSWTVFLAPNVSGVTHPMIAKGYGSVMLSCMRAVLSRTGCPHISQDRLGFSILAGAGLDGGTLSILLIGSKE